MAVQCKMARIALGLGVRDLAKMAEVSPSTVSKLEAGQPTTASSRRVVRQALEQAGTVFIDGEEPGVRLRKEGAP